jgi:hypothetical protein
MTKGKEMDQSRRSFLGSLAAVTALAAGARALAVPPEQTLESDPAKQFADACDRVRPTRRLSWFAINVDLLENLLPAGTVYDLPDRIGGYDYGGLHAVLLLPSTCRIDAVSKHFRFSYNEISVRVEDPSFREVLPGYCIEQVNPTYRRTKDGRAEFVGWSECLQPYIGGMQAHWQPEAALTINEMRALRGLEPILDTLKDPTGVL